MQIPEKKRYSGKYDPNLKIAVAREYLSSDLGYSSLAVKYGIPRTSIHDFVKWYKEKYPNGTVAPEIGEQKSLTSAFTKDGLSQANLQITALQMLIENASKELGVDLVKKFGTKQLKK